MTAVLKAAWVRLSSAKLPAPGSIAGSDTAEREFGKVCSRRAGQSEARGSFGTLASPTSMTRQSQKIEEVLLVEQLRQRLGGIPQEDLNPQTSRCPRFRVGSDGLRGLEST
jgi:hypothetical protein